MVRATLHAIGLMSGTSMDGIEVALLKTDGDSFIESCGHLHLAYSQEARRLLKGMEYAVQAAQGDLAYAETLFPEVFKHYLLMHPEEDSLEILNEHLNRTLQTHEKTITLSRLIDFSTQLHIDAVEKFREVYPDLPIDCVGYHGQTVFHQPKLSQTIQIGLGKKLAEATHLTVIYDFRTADVALGGQGAPFAPIYHRAIALRDKVVPIGIINCGGIANVTLILNENLDALIGFDAGPGNCLLDAYVKQVTKGQECMDRDGHYALKGKTHQPTLERLLIQQYRHHQPALDTHDFSLIPELQDLCTEDACATLVSFTVECMVQALSHHSNLPKHYVLCGGGAYHPGIVATLTKRLQETQAQDVLVETANTMHWNNQAIEAELMAYLAVRRLKEYPFSFPKTTGVPYPLFGGQIARPLIRPPAVIGTLLANLKTC